MNNNLNLICSSKTQSTQVILTFMLFYIVFPFILKSEKHFCVFDKKKGLEQHEGDDSIFILGLNYSVNFIRLNLALNLWLSGWKNLVVNFEK